MTDADLPDNPEESTATRHITGRETLFLWVRSGGRCAMCNKYLLEEPYREQPINLGERAHIAGWQNTPGSPRGNSSLPLSERNKADNLILLCMECHAIVDDKETRADYPEERLLEIKHEHEDRILHLTEMAKDRETAVFRVFGAVRGSLPEMARDMAMQTVIKGAGRYARFPMAPDRRSIEVDLSTLGDPEVSGDDAYWRIGKMQIDKAAERVREAIHVNHIRHLSLFALARIPLLVYLGYTLDDKVPVDVYQKRRGEDEGWLWPEEGPAKKFEVIVHRDGPIGSDVALILSLSGTIHPDDLPEDAADLALFEVRPVDDTPNPDLFRSRATVDSFTATYRALLSRLEAERGSAPAIRLFPAAPISAAIACGRNLMRDAHSALKVYDRFGDGFRLAITMNEKKQQ